MFTTSRSGRHSQKAGLGLVVLCLLAAASLVLTGCAGLVAPATSKPADNTAAPSIASLNPTSGTTGASVTITGANFGSSQGTSTVAFNGTATIATSWSVTSIVVTVPTGATTGSVIVTVGGVASAGVNFTVMSPAPNIASLSPTSGLVGASVTITGANFGATQGTSTVKFNGTTATPTSWSATSIVVPVPAGATMGNVVVTVGGVASNGVNFTVTAAGPSITSLNPTSGTVGASVTITGANFGATQGTSTVKFNGIAVTATSWTATSIVVLVPAGATTGNVVVTVGGAASNGVNFTVTVPVPSIASLNPASGLAGASVTITGANFGATQGTSTVKFNGTTAIPTSWSATSITAPVPTGATTGTVVVTVGGVASNGMNFTVTASGPSITSLNPTSGLVAAPVTITGTNFGATQGTSTVKFNGTTAAPASWSATSIAVPVPTGATTGTVVVTVGGVASNGVNFTVTVPAPSVTSLNPTSGLVGASVTISGTNFGATQGTSSVKFNGTTATPTSWSTTSIVATVPTGATTGNVVVTVGGTASNAVTFTVQTNTTPPTVSITAPASGATVSGSTTVTASASSSIGIASVQFLLDGVAINGPLTSAPYSFAWDTSSATNGSHTLGAQAKDTSGTVGNAVGVTVTASNSGTTPLQDFQARCATSGVIVCEGFDNASEFVPANWSGTGLYPGNDNTIEIVQDTTIYASGGGSLHYPIKANDGTGPTVRDDNWLQNLCIAHPPTSCNGMTFGQNSTFYVQFRYRIDANYASTDWEATQNGGSSPKIADFAAVTESCGSTEITTNNRNAMDMPMIYKDCGGNIISSLPGTTTYPGDGSSSSPPYLWQSGYYNCAYPETPSGGGCFTMPVNTWMTFYYMVQIGTWNSPNSHVKAWIGVDGQPLHTFVDSNNLQIDSDQPGFDAIWFNVYMTDFNTAATNPAANAWLDEVIVATSPIPAPSANGGGTPQ